MQGERGIRRWRLEGGDTNGFKIQNYSDPLGFSRNVRSFSRYPHARREKIENAGSKSLPKSYQRVACGERHIHQGGVFGDCEGCRSVKDLIQTNTT